LARLRTPPATAAALACILLWAGCGNGAGSEEFRIEGDTLTVYSSLPRQGDSAPAADAVAAGQRLALADARRRAGPFKVRLVELDSSTLERNGWDPSVVQANARRAADDDTTIAYLGELDLGGSAISVPATNSAGILQVSPLDGLTALTRRNPAEIASGPERYYPRPPRSFIRLVPSDLLQAEVLIRAARAEGARAIGVIHDDRLVGRELASQLGSLARRAKLTPTDSEEVRAGEEELADVARRMAEQRPDVVFYAGMTVDPGSPAVTALARELPRAKLYAASGMATDRFARLVRDADVEVASPLRPLSSYAPDGRRVLKRLSDQQGDPVGVEALYGYESMRLVLDSIERAGEGARDRAAVVREAFSSRPRRSVLGTYRITRGGDVVESRFAFYRVRGGRLVYTETLRPRR
jgi:branched-chain amino acid transport system substrate-binding protein